MTARRRNIARIKRLALVLALFGFGVTLIRNAWLSDDAYITFRTVDNLVNGRGLTWNPAERVQAFTHPLWMFLLSAVYAFTREAYLTSLLLSIVVSLLVVGLLALRGGASLSAALLGVLALTLSKSFVDYSTSGLENPLTHLLLVGFWLVFITRPPTIRRLFLLALIAALGATNRMDTALLFAPMVLYALIQTPAPWRLRLGALAFGALPFVLWEAFALFYYGFPFPNTAYAKLNVGLISQAELYAQGWRYFANVRRWDPLTPLVIGLGVAVAALSRDRRLLTAVAGVALYLFYVLRIGGDFMSGRFFAAPLLVAVAILIRAERRGPRLARAALLAVVVGVGLGGPYCPVRAGGEHSAGTDPHGITDEKGNYWSATALVRALGGAHLPDHDWAAEGRVARVQNPGVVLKGSIGFFGYFAGPDVHVVDLLALADPLLARLPPVDPRWSIGHLGRRPPAGYVESLSSGENRIADPNLARYYEKLSFVIRGDLFDPARLREIWKLNTGAYDRYLRAFAFSDDTTFVQRLRLTNPTRLPYAFAFVWNNDSAEAYLLDDASQPGRVYTVTWTIRADGVGFEGAHLARTSAIGPLSDDTTLNVGLILSPTPDLSVYEIFEHRYWFRLEGERLRVARQGVGWHNAEAPGGWWHEADVRQVIERLPAPGDF